MMIIIDRVGMISIGLPLRSTLHVLIIYVMSGKVTIELTYLTIEVRKSIDIQVRKSTNIETTDIHCTDIETGRSTDIETEKSTIIETERSNRDQKVY